MMKPKYYYDIEQGSYEWFEKKLGKFSGSKANDLLMKQSLKGYQNLIKQLSFEKITGQRTESFKSEWMENGNETENEARLDYEFVTGNEVVQVGLVELDSWTVCSPDGLVGADGMLEIKCVKWNTQIDYLLSQKVPTNYVNQIQFNLYVTNRKWCDFYSYHPYLNSFKKRIERDEIKIAEIKDKINISVENVQELIEKLK